EHRRRGQHLHPGYRDSHDAHPIRWTRLRRVRRRRGLQRSRDVRRRTRGERELRVRKRTQLLSVQVLDCSATGTTSGVIAGLDWLAANRVLPAVANMSFGLAYSSALNQAVSNVINAGVTVTASAGNSFNGENPDACQYSPASVPGVITVGSTGS